MPKLKPSRSEEENINRRIIVDTWMRVNRLDTQKAAAKLLHVSETTFSRRYSDPSKLTLSEIKRMHGLSPQELRRLVLGTRE